MRYRVNFGDAPLDRMCDLEEFLEELADDMEWSDEYVEFDADEPADMELDVIMLKLPGLSWRVTG